VFAFEPELPEVDGVGEGSQPATISANVAANEAAANRERSE
jgi:hypothetical protein